MKIERFIKELLFLPMVMFLIVAVLLFTLAECLIEYIMGGAVGFLENLKTRF